MASPLELMTQASDLMVRRGLTVKESSGWESRGRPYSFNPTAGVICHHTAAAEDIDSVLINGRSDLPGPLCHWALHKNGDVVLIAAGYANHAGASKSGYPSNSNGWGIEATGPVPNNSAYGEDAFPNYEEYIVMVQCIVETRGWGTSIQQVPGHKDSCDPPGRKPDPHFDMNTFRSRVAAGGGGMEDFLMSLSDAEQEEILRACRQVNAAVAKGQTSFESTIENTLGAVQSTYNVVTKLASDEGQHFKYLARGESVDGEIDASSQHYKDSHRGIYSMLLEIKKGLTGGGWAEGEKTPR